MGISHSHKHQCQLEVLDTMHEFLLSFLLSKRRKLSAVLETRLVGNHFLPKSTPLTRSREVFSGNKSIFLSIILLNDYINMCEHAL